MVCGRWFCYALSGLVLVGVCVWGLTGVCGWSYGLGMGEGLTAEVVREAARRVRGIEPDRILVEPGYMPETAGGYRMLLRALPEMREFRERLSQEPVSVEVLGDWIGMLTRKVKPGEHLDAEYDLAFIAVAVEEIEEDWADQYLRELAELKMAAMPMASRVARLCLECRERG